MRRSTWPNSDGTFSRAQPEAGRNWMKSDRCSDGISFDQSEFSRTKTPRKQYLCHLVSEFEKCSQLSDDMITLRTDVDQLKRGLEETQSSIEDLKFENQLSTDKLKFISQDIQDIKSNHFKLRDEVSKEFRKTYKRIGVIDKEMDVMKYRHNMANKKNSLDIESLRWEFNTSRSLESGYSAPVIPSKNTYYSDNLKTEDFKMEDSRLKDYSF